MTGLIPSQVGPQVSMPHPCPFSPQVLAAIARWLPETGDVLDPFAGVGRVHELAFMGRRTFGVELEPEWAGSHPWTTCGDATALPFPDDRFDAIATSPAFGNRMADSYDGRDGSRRFTYRIALRRPLSPGSGAAMQWGDDYRRLHAAAVDEMVRVVKPGGLVVVNMKDHVRNRLHIAVTNWWATTLAAAGLEQVAVEEVHTRGIAFQSNRAQLPEWVLVYRRTSGPRVLTGLQVPSEGSREVPCRPGEQGSEPWP